MHIQHRGTQEGSGEIHLPFIAEVPGRHKGHQRPLSWMIVVITHPMSRTAEST